MPDYRELSPKNTPVDQHNDRQEYQIHDAVVSVDLDKLANDVEMHDRVMSHLMGYVNFIPVDGPTGCSMTVQIPGVENVVSSECQIEATIPVETEADGLVKPSVWLRGQVGDETIFASVIDSQMKFPDVIQRVIVVPGSDAELTNAAVHELLDQTYHLEA